MSKNTVEIVTAFIAREQSYSPEDITLTTRLTDLGIDSLQAIIMFYEFEEQFDVKIPIELIETTETVGNVVDLLEELTKISSH